MSKEQTVRVWITANDPDPSGKEYIRGEMTEREVEAMRKLIAAYVADCTAFAGTVRRLARLERERAALDAEATRLRGNGA